MTDIQITDPQPDEPIVDAVPVTYPSTTVGMLMRDRDAARASAVAACAERDRFQALADASDARADSLQESIDALGGEQPMVPIDAPA